MVTAHATINKITIMRLLIFVSTEIGLIHANDPDNPERFL